MLGPRNFHVHITSAFGPAATALFAVEVIARLAHVQPPPRHGLRDHALAEAPVPVDRLGVVPDAAQKARPAHGRSPQPVPADAALIGVLGRARPGNVAVRLIAANVCPVVAEAGMAEHNPLSRAYGDSQGQERFGRGAGAAIGVADAALRHAPGKGWPAIAARSAGGVEAALAGAA